VWAPVGERPIAIGHHRFEWLYVTGFVEPVTGKTVWNISNNVSKEYFERVLADFAKSNGVGKKKRAVVQLDNAGWHGLENLTVPDGIRLVFQPAHSPELQPAEHLWAFIDEALANTYFETLDDLDKVVGDRCVALMEQHDMIRASTLFYWWPRQRDEVINRRWYNFTQPMWDRPDNRAGNCGIEARMFAAGGRIHPPFLALSACGSG
jgi:hypothetical protein